ncbi:hypothetical protein PG991_013201 [Apiospora marii]|uniref:Zn(2)-C6 fungal-type domain-containing protein n=1 Tax=Apiospora marii TaxID=335849 RepID=A0ABR1R5G9_9PEZI
MDQVFRGPQTMKKPSVVHSDEGWRPSSPSYAIDFMGYFDQRVALEFSQVNHAEKKHGKKLGLSGVEFEMLERCARYLAEWYKTCKEYELFTKDQGWCYDKPYSELWKGEWRKTGNDKPTWLDTILNPQEMDREPASPTASSSAPPTPTGGDSTQPATPEIPTVATSPVIPAAATPVGSSVVPTAGIPSTPTAAAATTVGLPQKRTPLPFSADQQPDQKRSRPSPSPSLSPKTQPSRLPPTGTFSRLCLAGSNGESSGTSQPAAGGDVAVASASSSTTTSKQSKGKANGSDLKPKTVNEQAKADRLLDDGVGQDATSPCKNCQKVAGRRCLVARDPLAYKSLKCEHCIRNKLGGCFCADNPGFQYDQQVIDTMRKIEQSRKKS